LRWWWYIIWT